MKYFLSMIIIWNILWAMIYTKGYITADQSLIIALIGAVILLSIKDK
jgi:hypothetical protein